MPSPRPGPLATHLGFEAILGAFIAGAILRLVDSDAERKHPLFHPKLDAIGYGFLIPVFFVTSGLTFNLSVLFSNASTVLRVPLFLLALSPFVTYWSPARTDVMRCVLKPSQCIRPM
jgi:Kef-type K+ transport system membrane component KefB